MCFTRTDVRKQTNIHRREQTFVNGRLDSRGVRYWPNTLQQSCDGLTKVQARQRPTDILRCDYHALKKLTRLVTAGKKLTTDQKLNRVNKSWIKLLNSRHMKSREQSCSAMERLSPLVPVRRCSVCRSREVRCRVLRKDDQPCSQCTLPAGSDEYGLQQSFCPSSEETSVPGPIFLPLQSVSENSVVVFWFRHSLWICVFRISCGALRKWCTLK